MSGLPGGHAALMFLLLRFGTGLVLMHVGLGMLDKHLWVPGVPVILVGIVLCVGIALPLALVTGLFRLVFGAFF